MGTLLVAIVIVAASAAGFGFALFGRRPVPQPAIPGGPAGITAGSSAVPQGTAAETTSGFRTRGSATDPTLSRAARVRSALLLAATVVGLAAFVGGVLSIVVVVVVLVIT